MHGNSDVVTYITSRAVGTPGWILKKNINGDSALHMAARAGNMLSVTPLLQIEEASSSTARYRDNRVREKNRRGNTPVHEALISGHKPVASYLIQVDPEVLYCLNYKRESPLYMAVEAGLPDIVSLILQNMTDHERMNQQFKLKSPVHLAIKKKNRVVLEAMFNGNPSFIYFKDDKGRTPLHYGAYFGYYEEVRIMLGKYSLGATLRDRRGLCPIHLASIGGHVNIIKLLLLEFIDLKVVRDKSDRNILHHAARNGRYNVVKFILNNPNMEGLLNMQDVRGNIPLHYATVGWHPRIVSALTWDHRVDVKVANHTGMTALDAAEAYIDERPSFRQRLTWSALKSAGVPRSRPPQTNTLSNNSNVEYFATRVNTLLVVATLLATLAFAAGFTMPGGYSSSENDLGMATMLRKQAFQVFVVSDSITVYFSLVAILSLVFALSGDLNMMYIAVSFSQPILGMALIMGSVAFTSGAYVVLRGLRWLSILVLVFGSIFTAVLFILAIPLCISFTSRNMFSRYISYFPYCLMMLASGSYKEDELCDELDDEAERHEDEASVGQ
ncbi:hypothetical protein ACJIZ3_007399 [Penstemon smallii]|uniref:PGG domain-containing protein n=1 Tax=Penstemon smallii TaxID=265156 RepID=A0ABD3SAE7_9LAMI